MRIRKINDNEVEVTEQRTMKDVNDNDVEVYDERNKVVYGASKLQSELDAVNAQLTFLGDARAIAEQVNKLNTLKSRLETIQTEF